MAVQAIATPSPTCITAVIFLKFFLGKRGGHNAMVAHLP